MSDFASLPCLPAVLTKALQSVNRGVPVVSCHLPPSLVRYNCSPPLFTQTLPAFYEDNSIQKETRMREKGLAHSKALQRDFCLVRSRMEQVRHQQAHLRHKKKAKAHERAMKRHIAAFKTTAEAAAVTIQRHVRGWLCRLRFEEDVIQINKAEVQGRVQDMEGFAIRFYMTTGNGPAEASVKIQRAFRRYRRIKMLRIVADAYAKYRDYVERSFTPIINSFIRWRLAYDVLKAKKFLRFRARRLDEIRHNLARLKLERWWKRLNLTFKSAQDRIKRFRRRRNAHKLKPMKTANSPPRKAVDEPVPTLDIPDNLPYDSGQDVTEELRGRRSSIFSSDISESGATQLLEEAKARARREELKQKFTACGIYKAKEVSLMPLFAEKTGLDLPKLKPNVFTRLMLPTEAMRFRSTTAYMPTLASPRPGHRRTVTSTPKSILNKRSTLSTASPHLSADESLFKKKSPEPNYLQPTESYSLAVEARSGTYSERPTVLPRRHWLPKSSLLAKTVAFAVKEREKKWLDDDPRGPWLPLTGAYEAEYVPALDNLFYTPKPFKALPLDRKILVSPQWTPAACHVSTPDRPVIDIPSLNHYQMSFPVDVNPRVHLSEGHQRHSSLNASI